MHMTRPKRDSTQGHLMQQPCSMAQSCTRPERLLPDSFWMFSYKVALCPLKHPHDWEKCVYAHEGEKARRRHPNKYQAVQCPEARAKKVCPRGEECPCTHHLFEYWLHPDRYMTCLCELGSSCNRPICFFAHHEAELRPLPDGLSHAPNSTGSSRRHAAAAATASTAAASAAFCDPHTSPLNGLPTLQLGPAAAVVSGAAQGVTFDMGLRQASISSVNAAADAGFGPAAATYTALGGPSSAAGLHQQSLQAQQLSISLGDVYVRPGFTVLGTLSPSSSPSSAVGPMGPLNGSPLLGMTVDDNALRAQLQATRAASHPVVVLEAPAPMPASQDMQLLQAATYFSQLNLSTAGSDWQITNPSPFVGKSGSNMSLASNSSSTTGALKTAGSTSTVALRDAQQQQQVMALASLSPSASPLHNSSNAQQVATDQQPEHLSFSLWDPNMPLGPDGTFMQGEHLSALGQGGVENSLGNPRASAFGGFAAGDTAFSQASTPPTSLSAQVLDLASTAANRLLVSNSQHITRASTPGSTSAATSMLAGQAGVEQGAHVDGNGSSVTAKEARLTLLRAWLNAAVASEGDRASRNSSSLQQQEEELLTAAIGGATSARSCSLTPKGSAVAVEDLTTVLSHEELLQLLQQLHQRVQQ